MTGYEGLTAKTVGRVREAWKQDQQLYERIFDQIDALVLRGVQAIQDGDVKLLGELMNICHGMLNALQVSTPELEQLVDIARENGALGAKLTGGGGGGSIIAVCEDNQQQIVDAIRAAAPSTTIEILTPDFRHKPGAIETVAAARPDVYNHNVETVPRHYRSIRPGASYEHSIALLERGPSCTKWGWMSCAGARRVSATASRSTGVRRRRRGRILIGDSQRGCGPRCAAPRPDRSASLDSPSSWPGRARNRDGRAG